MATLESAYRGGHNISLFLQALANMLTRNQQIGEVNQARDRAFTDVGATPVSFNRQNRPLGGGMAPSLGDNLTPYVNPDISQGGGQPEFMKNLVSLIGQGNAQAEKLLPFEMALQPKLQSFGPGQTVYEVDQLTNQLSPKFQTPFAPRREYYGAPTQLQKHQDELAAIRAKDPNDPRIPQYEAVIEKLQIGVPGYRFIEGPGGELIIADPKRGKVKGGSGTYTETPEAVNMQIRSLADIGESARNIKSVLSRGSVGPVAGRARKVGTLFFDDKDQQALINYLGQLRPIIYGLSGKQINEAEQAWLDREILPKLEQPDANFGVTLNIFNQWVDRKLKSMKEQYPGAIIPSSAQQGGGIMFDPNDFEQWRKTRK